METNRIKWHAFSCVLVSVLAEKVNSLGRKSARLFYYRASIEVESEMFLFMDGSL